MSQCGCKIMCTGSIYTHIEYCPLHAAAPNLLEACKFALNSTIAGDPTGYVGLKKMLREAIALAESPPPKE